MGSLEEIRYAELKALYPHSPGLSWFFGILPARDWHHRRLPDPFAVCPGLSCFLFFADH
jgi:hypothetical protein